MKNINPSKMRSRRYKKRFIWIVLLFSVAVGATGLVVNAFRDTIVFFYSPQDIQTKSIPIGQYFRIGGLVKKDSLEKKGQFVSFVITDTVFDVKAQYTGILPALFREGQGVVAEGVMNEKGVMIAKTILAKHDEKYMPKEVVDSLKKQGKWEGEK